MKPASLAGLAPPCLGLLVLMALTSCMSDEPTLPDSQMGWNELALQAAKMGGEPLAHAVMFREKYETADSVLLSALNPRFGYRYQTIPAVVVYLPETVTPYLRMHTRVKHVSIGRRGGGVLRGEEASWGFDAHKAGYAHSHGLKGSGFVIGVVDTGVDCGRPDIDCLPGRSFVDGQEYWADGWDHGTGVAGVAAGVVGNGGYKGIAGSAKILPVKVMSNIDGRLPEGCVTSSQGIDWASANGANVINLSYWSGAWDSVTYASDCQVEQATIIAALSRAAVVTAAAGNIPQDGDSVVYPARWNYGHMIVTSGLTRDKICDMFGIIGCANPVRWYPWSSYGSQVDVAAAGDDVKILHAFTSTITEESGTSLAAPHAAGAAVLVMEKWPVLRNDPVAVVEHLRYTARPPDDPFSYNPLFYGGGVLDIQAAIDTDPCSYRECGEIPEL